MAIMRARALVFMCVAADGVAFRAPSAVCGLSLPRSHRLPRGGRLHAANNNNNNNNNNPFASFFSSPPFASQLPAPLPPPLPAEGVAAGAARRYFAAWNRRDMAAAVREFDDACVYEDTQYRGAFVGKVALTAHLDKATADCAVGRGSANAVLSRASMCLVY
jgi:hypothetical protein